MAHDVSPSQTPQAPRYQIPTHLAVPDKIDIPLLGVTFSLTMRQGILCFFGFSAAVALWRSTLSWTAQSVVGMLLHWSLAGLVTLITIGLALLEIRGRKPEHWGLIVLRYALMPRVLVWQSVAEEHLVMAIREEARDALWQREEEQEGVCDAQA